MVEIGTKLVCEKHRPDELVTFARRTEDSAFDFANISDHYHPWISAQGESPMVWHVVGAIAEATDDLRLGTGVTCPIVRIHPAIIAQAAATAATMLEGRFFFGVGTGENLSEHVTGERWPEHEVRLEMLEEAVEVVRGLWEGENYSHHGKHYTVENARLFTLPEKLPDIPVAADGPNAARVAGEIGDGLIAVRPDEELLEAYGTTGSDDGMRYGEVSVCWAEDEAEAIETAHELWPLDGLPGELLWDLPTPAHFERAVQSVTKEDIAEAVACGPDPEAHVEAIREYVDAGFDHVAIHQIGPGHEEFVEFYEEEVLPAFR